MSKNYLIIGASSGIGEACARRLAADDVKLIIVARRKELLEKLADELPGEVVPVAYDLHDLDHIKDLFEPCTSGGFKLDGMVFTAGIDGTWPVKVNDIHKMREMMDINCMSFVEAAKVFYTKKYSVDGGSIVAISSIASVQSEKGMLSYTVSKAALNASVKVMANEFARRGIRVNAILPGGVSTPMAEAKGAMMEGVAGENADSSDPVQPLGMIPSENIADQVAHLLSDASRYTTGSLISISGGRGL